MRQLSPAGQQVISDLAQRHGFSRDAVLSMLDSLINGRGSMAQFNHPEFGGSGQWMRGGMIMVSDMFNNVLKGRIDGLCHELSGLVASEPDLLTPASFQSQTQGFQQQRDAGLGQHQQDRPGPQGGVSLFIPSEGSGDWWPPQLGRPNSAGAQNGVRYAYFAAARRLAIELNGRVTVYDTLDHQITGFSQQQSRGGSLTFSSQHGLVDVTSLPVLQTSGGAAREPSAPAASSPATAAPANHGVDIVATIEKLAELHRKGILSDEEFTAKKTELLSRL
jgi:Short C-terminal domain